MTEFYLNSNIDFSRNVSHIIQHGSDDRTSVTQVESTLNRTDFYRHPSFLPNKFQQSEELSPSLLKCATYSFRSPLTSIISTQKEPARTRRLHNRFEAAWLWRLVYHLYWRMMRNNLSGICRVLTTIKVRASKTSKSLLFLPLLILERCTTDPFVLRYLIIDREKGLRTI